MKQLTCALVGAGNRGLVYCDYSLERPDELKVVAVVETNAVRRKQAQERYHLADQVVFDNLDDFLQANVRCDFVVNATMDEAHYQTASKLIEAKYDMLLEKPITAKKDELLDLQARAERNGVQVFICHVLRYTPFFKAVKSLIDEGKIGKILTMEMNEHVWIAHFLDSFVRGKWNSESKCGSGFLLAKSCHDTDLMCWLNNSTQPKTVSSLGVRALFTSQNVPSNSAEYCYDCPLGETCLYNAQKVHLEFDSLPFQTWADMDKPVDQITKEEKAEYLRHNDYGKCAYKVDGDIVDRQSIIVQYENGSICSFTMVGGTSKAGRKIHVCGTHGEIEGKLEDNTFALRVFNRSQGKFCYDETIVDVTRDVHESADYGGHAGGDFAIMYELVRYLNGDTSSVSITSLQDSINSHLVVYAAEESRKTNKAVTIK